METKDTKVAIANSDSYKYSMMRQPYRITMAKWDFTPVEKRILTAIIFKLQKEITAIEKGVPIGQLELFASNANSDTVDITFSRAELVINANNYKHVETALDNLTSTKIRITLPETKGLKSKKPENELIITNLLQQVNIKPYARDITVRLHHAMAMELVKVSSGLTSFAKEVMFLTNNSYTQKIYEILSHWKDKEVMSFSIDEFKEKLFITNKYKETGDIIRRIINPAQIELKEIADIYFEFSPSKVGQKIVRFNFAIKHRKALQIEPERFHKEREFVKVWLRDTFKFTKDDFEAIKELFENPSIVRRMPEKLEEVRQYILKVSNDPKNYVKNIPSFTITSLLKKFASDK